MSYLKRHAVRPRVDERSLLNRPGYHGGAFVHVYVEDTSARKIRNSVSEPRLKLQIADCSNTIALEFSVVSHGERENSLYKIDTLIGALTRFRDGLAAEAELYAKRRRDHGQRERRAA
jgi:hypothetical protein